MILASIIAICYPIQFLAPAAKGILIYPLSSWIGYFVNHLEGLNSKGLS
jgi:hypothetical protein